MKIDDDAIPTMDIHLSAFLQFQGVVPELVKQSGRVIFHFPNCMKVTKLIQQYNKNPDGIPLLDYVQCLRRLRSQMISLRD